jgi:choline kinase
MKLFILAAGKGERLWPLTKNTPKSLINFEDGSTLLERQIANSISSGIFNEIIIITGYKAEQIDAKINIYKNDIKISTIYNPFYNISNNLISLWTAHYMMRDDDFMITNGDNIYKDGVFEKVYKDKPHIIQLTVDYKEQYDTDDMKVKLDDTKNIVRVHKDIPAEQTDGESVGLALIRGERYRKLFVAKILHLIRNEAYLNKFWLEIFNSLAEDGVAVNTVQIDKNDWREVDFHPDITIIKKLISKGF